VPIRNGVLGILTASVALSGCALKSDVRRVETELAAIKAESAARDSATAARLGDLIMLQQTMLDSMQAGRRALVGVRGDLSGEHFTIQQLLVQVQELTGQSQQRLSELRAQLESERAAPVGEVPSDMGGGVAPPAGGGPSAEQMYQVSVQQLRRGSLGTARLGFRQLIQTHPSHERVPDAIYFLGETFPTQPDSAGQYFSRVIREYPSSPRAPTALYKLGLFAEQRQDPAEATALYRRVVDQYPSSDAASLARDRLRALGQ
jgi:tol-pal system protein YbgF